MREYKIVITVTGDTQKAAFARLKGWLPEIEQMSRGSIAMRRKFGDDIDLKLTSRRNYAADDSATVTEIEDDSSGFNVKELKRVRAALQRNIAGPPQQRANEWFNEPFCAQPADGETELIYEASATMISDGIPAWVSVSDGEQIHGFSGEQIVSCIRTHGGLKTEFDPEVVAWLWADRDRDLIQLNFAIQAECSTNHWAFRKFAEDTSFATPDTLGALYYCVEELGEACRVYNLIQRPGDARNNRKPVTVDDLHRELADLWLMLDTAQGQSPMPLAGVFNRDPSTFAEIASLTAQSITKIHGEGKPVADQELTEALQYAKDAICRYPGMDLRDQTQKRLTAWKGRIK